jgi:hypothetical protein
LNLQEDSNRIYKCTIAGLKETIDLKEIDQNQIMDKNFKVPDSKSQWPLLGYKRTLLAGIAILSRQS